MKLKLTEFSDATIDVVDTAYKISDVYTKELDEEINKVKGLLKQNAQPTSEELNYHIMLIPILIYSVTDSMQELGIKSDAAKMQRKEVFNTTYHEQDYGTVQHKTSLAQQACQNEQMIEDIFYRVYKACENKIDVAEMLHGSLKKVLQWRLTEMEVTQNSRGGY